MREIKFRAWDKNNKIMHHDVEFIRSGTEGNDWIIFKSDKQKLADEKVLDNPYFQQQIELMQYTGLKDKNGKEIYEGDLIKFTEIDEDSCFGREDTNVVEVQWLEDIAQFRAIFKSGRRTELHFVVKLPTVVSCEIIGNIYESEHLIDNTDMKV